VVVVGARFSTARSETLSSGGRGFPNFPPIRRRLDTAWLTDVYTDDDGTLVAYRYDGRSESKINASVIDNIIFKK